MPFDPKQIAKKIVKAQKEISNGLVKNEDAAVKEILDLLKQFQKEIKASILQLDSEKFNTIHLSKISDQIDVSIRDFSLRAGEVISKKSTTAAKAGQSVWELKNTSNIVNPVLSDQMLSVITTLSTEMIKSLADEIAVKTKAALQRAVLGSQTPFETMKQVSQIVGKRGQSGAFYSAERIVRTEMARSYNAADKMITDKIVDSRPEDLPMMKKIWVAVDDFRTRPSHLAASGQVVDYDDKFTVDGEKLFWSVIDPSGSAGNNINCRCQIFVVPENMVEETLSELGL